MATHEGIRLALDGYAQALHARDLDAAVACFTPDAVVMAPGVPTASNSGVRDLYAQIVGALDLDISFRIDAIVSDGDDEAAVFTTSSGTQTLVVDGSESAEANREAFVFVRHDGRWKINRYLFNTVS